MYELSIANYIDGDVDTVRDRLAETTEPTPANSSVEVTPVDDDVTMVVVRTIWDGSDEETRRTETLAATRYATRIFDDAVAA